MGGLARRDDNRLASRRPARDRARAEGTRLSRILDFNGDLRSANVSKQGLQIAYQSNSRAVAVLSENPRAIEIDGVPMEPKLPEYKSKFVLVLPRGQHVVEIDAAQSSPQR